MRELLISPFFSFLLCIILYYLASKLYNKVKFPLLNPLLVSLFFLIVFLKVFNISYEEFYAGGQIIGILLAPSVVCLALPIYRQRELLKKHFLPFLVGTGFGALSCMTCIFFLCKLFGLDSIMVASMLPKSVTAAVSLAISSELGGILPITMLTTALTGISGNILFPYFRKLSNVNSRIAEGIAIGTASHAIGTAKALETSDVHGAMAGLAISLTALFTVLFSLIFALLL